MGTEKVRQQRSGEVAGSLTPEVGPAGRTEVPRRFLKIEQPPISAFDDNPAFNEVAAAQILGVSADLLKKWRKRDVGPSYIQYGPFGPVRYALNDLMEFRLTHTIKTKPMPATIELRRSPKTRRLSTR